MSLPPTVTLFMATASASGLGARPFSTISTHSSSKYKLYGWRYASVTVCLLCFFFLFRRSITCFVTPGNTDAPQVQPVVIPQSGLARSWKGHCGGVSFWELHGPLIPVISAVPMVTGAVFPKQTPVGCLSVAARTQGALRVCPCHRSEGVLSSSLAFQIFLLVGSLFGSWISRFPSGP